MSPKHILVAEGDRNMRQALFTAITRLGHAVELAEDGEEALRKFQDGKLDLVFLDLKLGRAGGPKPLAAFKKSSPATPVVVMTSSGGLDEAVAAMREGAQDYLVKPFPAGIVEETIARVASMEGDGREGPQGGPERGQALEERLIVHKSPIMGRLLELARGIAKSDATVLLEGESGTGKELLARFIHSNSDRRMGPFVAVNCAGLPESLLESELFGHEKGAFTGALARKPGKFDLASGGSILLDEITEMDVSLQAKLLRVLQEGEIDPVGGKGPHKIDVRVIATTNRKLKAWVDEGKFRADLYYRLNVMPFFIPSLRDRMEDIEPLAGFFVGKYARLHKREVSGLSKGAVARLMAHDWPGNIRELENTVARAVLMAGGETIGESDVFMDESGFMAALEEGAWRARAQGAVPAAAAAPAPSPAGSPAGAPAAASVGSPGPAPSAVPPAASPAQAGGPPAALGAVPAAWGSVPDAAGIPVMTIDEMEKRLIGQALAQTSGNRTHAARLLGISVRTLRNKLNEYTRGEGADYGEGAVGMGAY